MTANGMLSCRERENNTAVSLFDELARFTHQGGMNQLTDLEDLVLSLKVFILIRVALRKLVDVDVKLPDLLSDLLFDNELPWSHSTYIYLDNTSRISFHTTDACMCCSLIPSSSFCRPLLVSGCQLWPVWERCWPSDAGPSYTPHPEVEDCKSYAPQLPGESVAN